MKCAVITGATKGIGRELVMKFASENFAVACCARQQTGLNKLKREIFSLHPQAQLLPFRCDVANPIQLQAFVKAVEKTFGPPDVVVHNAGVFMPGKIISEPNGTLEKLMEVNLHAAYRLSRMLLPRMIKRRSGHLFLMSSVAGLQAYENGGAYSITKFAMNGLGKALREELKEHNIRVTTLFTGATLTDSWRGTSLPASRFMKASDVAKLVFDIYSLSENTVVEEVLLRPMQGDI